MKKTLAFLGLGLLAFFSMGPFFRLPIDWGDQNRDMYFDIGNATFDNADRVTVSKTGWDLKKLELLFSLPYTAGGPAAKCSLYAYADSSTTKAAADSMIIYGDGYPAMPFFMEFPQDVDNAVIVNISGLNGYVHYFALYGGD